MNLEEAKQVIRIAQQNELTQDAVKNLNQDTRKMIHRAAKCLRKGHEVRGGVELVDLEGRLLAAATRMPEPSHLPKRIAKGVGNLLHVRVPSRAVMRDLRSVAVI